MLSKTIQVLNQAKTIFSFYNGEEAINFLVKNASYPDKLPDIIFLDVNMPVMNGWEFMKQYAEAKHSLNKSILIYITTSSDNIKDLTAAKDISDVEEYIVKPLSAQKLKQIFR